MNKNIGVKSLVFFAALILGVGLASGSRAAAQESDVSGAANPDQTSQSVPGGPGFDSLSGHAFVPASNAVNYSRGIASVYSTDSSETVFYAPVDILDGATINQLVLYYYDTSNDLS